jgi:hypothetical protein
MLVVAGQHPGFGCVERDDPRLRPLLPVNLPINPYVPWPNWHLGWQLDNFPNEVNGISRNQVRRTHKDEGTEGTHPSSRSVCLCQFVYVCVRVCALFVCVAGLTTGGRACVRARPAG